MLILTRKPGEGLVIGDDIVITVVEVKGESIRLGIEAPREKKIYRQEIYDRISRENQDAAKWSTDDLDLLQDRIKTRSKT